MNVWGFLYDFTVLLLVYDLIFYRLLYDGSLDAMLVSVVVFRSATGAGGNCPIRPRESGPPLWMLCGIGRRRGVRGGFRGRVVSCVRSRGLQLRR